MLEILNMAKELDNVQQRPIQQGNIIYLPTAKKPSGITVHNIPEWIVWLYQYAAAAAT